MFNPDPLHAHLWCPHPPHLAINDALRIVTGYLRPTPPDNLHISAGIQPAELLRKGATLSLARRAMEPGHLLHSALTCPLSGNTRRLKSRHPFPFVPATQQLVSSSDNNNNIRVVLWADHRCNAEWLDNDNTTRLRTSIPDIGTHPPGMALPRTVGVRLNRLFNSVGRFRSCLHKWGMPLLTVNQSCINLGFSFVEISWSFIPK